MVALVVALQLAGIPGDAYGCSEQDLQSVRFGLTMVARGDELMLEQMEDQGTGGSTARCVLIRLSRSARLGWVQARRVAARGGHPDLLAPVRSSLNELEQLKDDTPPLALEAEYAQTSIRAAVSAAQDERPEMELLLTHARDLSERLTARGRAALWPRSFNLLAGELWFEVDRFEESRAAYDRAVRAEASPIALVGLARAQSRLGRLGAACATYKRIPDATAALRKSAAADLAHCQ